MSAYGADAGSAAFYSRVKGETERALRSLALNRLVIVRPSLLRTPREDWRAAEWLALQFTRPLGRLVPASLRPIPVKDVAAAMLLAVRGPEAVAVLENAQLFGASERLERGE